MGHPNDGDLLFINPDDFTDTYSIHVSGGINNFIRAAYSNDGNSLMLVGDVSGNRSVWDVNINSQTVRGHYNIQYTPESVGFTPDDSQYVVGDNFNSGAIYFGQAGTENYIDTISNLGMRYAMYNTHFIYSFESTDNSDPVTTANNFPTDGVKSTYGSNPSGTLSTQTAAPGSNVDVSGSGFKPNTDVTITLHSTPVVLATVKANASGTFSATVTIPKDTVLGSHQIISSGLDANSNQASSTLNLTVSRLAATGFDVYSQLIIIGSLISIGFVLVRKRRQFINYTNN